MGVSCVLQAEVARQSYEGVALSQSFPQSQLATQTFSAANLPLTGVQSQYQAPAQQQLPSQVPQQVPVQQPVTQQLSAAPEPLPAAIRSSFSVGVS